jgi:uncharacterized membrane-anchored protein
VAASRLQQRRRARAARSANGGGADGFTGRARLGRRTKRLIPRLGPGDIAVIDHEDVDRVCAEDLVETGVRNVVNCRRSTSGSYPNRGPLIMAEAGVHVVDVPGASLFDLVEDGQTLTLRGGELYRDGELIASGEVQDLPRLTAAYEESRRRIGEALEAFAENTMAHLREERDLLAGKIDLPDFETRIQDRPVLLVVRGPDHQKDLRALRPYIRDMRPVLIAVDGGADALIAAGHRPDLVVGDMDSAADAALRVARELVVHAYPDGRAPGRERLDTLGLPYKVVPAPATSEDVAMLIAAEKGARLIVCVGTHFNLVEFLDKNRRGMSSTFLTRLRVGEILVDAKGVSRLYRPTAGRGPIVAVTLAALAAFIVVLSTSPSLGPLLDLIWLKIQVLLGLG